MTTKKLTLLKRPFNNVVIPAELLKSHKELCWLYQEGESSCGVKSNFNSMIRALKTSASHQDETAEDQLCALIDHQRSLTDIFKSSRQWRNIIYSLEVLPSKSKAIIEYFFYEKQFDPSVEMFFGQGIALITLTPTFKSKFSTTITNLNQLKHHIIHDQRRMLKIKKEISELYLQALTDYNSIKESK